MTLPKPLSRMEAYSVTRRVSELQAEIAKSELKRARLNATISEQEAEILALREAIGQIHASLSWRLSAPVRIAGSLLRTMLPHLPALRRICRDAQRRPSTADNVILPENPVDRSNYIPLHTSEGGSGTVTIEILHRLSQSL
ncbi:hypothetical protein [Acidisoma sp. 7E03]